MKIIVIGGYPGSGKSTIMKRVIEELEAMGADYKFAKNRSGIVSYMESKKVLLLGSYEPDETFPGTDRLPMNVQPEAQKLLLEKAVSSKGKVFVFEGDRLFNEKMLTFLGQHFEVVLCIVFMSRDLLEKRRQARSDQNASWRKGRETKVDRITMSHPVHHHLQNDTSENLEACVQELVQEILGQWKSKPVSSKIKDLWR